MKLKTCSHCREALLPEQFHRNRDAADGLDHRCKECAAHARRTLRQQDPEHFREFDVQKDQRRAAVQLAARYALSQGRLQREPCFVCGAIAEMHHPSYSAPLLVTWLCRSHHRQLHAEHSAQQLATA